MDRQQAIARSIVAALDPGDTDGPKNQHSLGRLLSVITAFFTLCSLPLDKIGADKFRNLRKDHWKIDDTTYTRSFEPAGGKRAEEALQTVGDMGYSGSTFFETADKRYLVKSVPRHFEHSFFRDDLLQPYMLHMAANGESLLIRICDFLASPYFPLGSLLGLAPTHHIVMENIQYGQEAESTWQSWDLKPQSYFFPERDIANGKLASEATKSRLADDFHDKIVLTARQADALIAQLEKDTQLLADHNAVDYSLFLIRIGPPNSEDPFADGAPEDSGPEDTPDSLVPTKPPATPPSPSTWRTGVPGAGETQYVYRVAILDFFWAKHKAQPRLMTLLIRAWNLLVSRHGHMSITTDATEYRERFLKMCREFVEVKGEGEGGSGDGEDGETTGGSER